MPRCRRSKSSMGAPQACALPTGSASPWKAQSDPCHLALDLLGVAAAGETARQIGHYEWGPSFLGIYVALERPVAFMAGAEAAAAGYIHASHASVDALARSFADLRAGHPSEPMVGIIDEAARDPSRAPAGRGLMKFVVHFVPWRPAIGDWDSIKEAYADSGLEWLDTAFLPGLRPRITARSVQSPMDYERRMPSAVYGTHQHGAYLPYQIGPLRPVPAMAGYRSPVANVYLCGAGSHPGSGVTMAPGRNAAQVICAELRRAFLGEIAAARQSPNDDNGLVGLPLRPNPGRVLGMPAADGSMPPHNNSAAAGSQTREIVSSRPARPARYA